MRRDLFFPVFLVAALTAASEARAQRPCPEPPEGQAVYALCQLEIPPRPRLDTATFERSLFPICPSTLMRVIVDERGRVQDPVALDSPTGQSPACQSVARRWTFAPGFRRGSAVAARLVVRFRFAEPQGQDSIWDPLISWSTRADTLTMAIEWRAPAPGAFPPFAPAARDSAIAAVMRHVAERGFQPTIDHVCLDMAARASRYSSVVALMGTMAVPAHPRAECPSIEWNPDGSVRYIPDPPYLHVGIRGRAQPAATEALVIDAWYGRGMAGAGYLCRATRGTPDWSVRCYEVWSS